MKNILVVGHPRSGNHFLINTIGLNFDGYVADRWVSPFRECLDADATLKRMQRFPIFSKFVFKCHLESYFFEKCWDILREKFHIFYMIRDGRDVMTSFFFYTRKREKVIKGESGEKINLLDNNLSKFIRCDICVYGESFRILELKPTSNMIERWTKHIESWINRPEIHIIRYEELNVDFNNTLDKIGKILEQTPKGIRPDLFKNRAVKPRKGIVGDYKNFFTKKSLVYFDGIAGNMMKKLNYY